MPHICVSEIAGSLLIQVMVCRLFGAKPLPEPMLAYCQLDSWEQISVKSKFCHVHSRKFDWKWRLPKWRTFCPVGDGLIPKHFVITIPVQISYWHQSITWTNVNIWHSFHDNIYLNTQDINSHVVFESYTFEIPATTPLGQWVKWHYWLLPFEQRFTNAQCLY